MSSRKPEDSQKEQEIAEKMKEMQSAIENAATSSDGSSGSDKDVLFAEAGRFIIEKDKASIGMLQRWFKIGLTVRQESWISWQMPEWLVRKKGQSPERCSCLRNSLNST